MGDRLRGSMLASSDARCSFSVEPGSSYEWDPACSNGGLGCFADGEHNECRWCGFGPYAPCTMPNQPAPSQQPAPFLATEPPAPAPTPLPQNAGCYYRARLRPSVADHSMIGRQTCGAKTMQTH